LEIFTEEGMMVDEALETSISKKGERAPMMRKDKEEKIGTSGKKILMTLLSIFIL